MMRTPAGHKVYAMGAEYPSASALYDAAKMVRDAGFKRWTCIPRFQSTGWTTRWVWENPG